MEVIRLSGYTELEKMEIAKRFLVRKQMEATGLDGKQIDFQDDGINSLIQYYTREAGVRNLEREIGNVCRKVARQVVNDESGKDKKQLAKAVINGDEGAGAAGAVEVPRPGDGEEERNRRRHGPGLDRSGRPDCSPWNAR